MSNGSASQRSDQGALSAARSDDWIERLTGARSSKPTFYAEWRRKSRGLDRAIEALKAISAALCTTTNGPRALCEAVVEALERHFDATVTMLRLFPEASFAIGPPATVSRSPDPDLDAVAMLAELEATVRETRGPVVRRTGSADAGTAVGIPVVFGSELIGILMIGLRAGAAIDDSDISILETAANQLAVALANACTFDETERLRARAVAGWSEADRQARELALRNRQLESAHRRLAEAGQRHLINHERQRIARELHDSVAQHLISIGMNLEWCRQQGPHPVALHRRVTVSQELTRAALTQMRAAIFELSALDGTRSGLRQALFDLADQFRAATPLQVAVRCRGRSRMLSDVVNHAVFNIAQEAMFNVARHADAQRAWVELHYLDGVVRLSVADDGTGDPATVARLLAEGQPTRGHHRGLVNIRERVAELSGAVTAKGRRGGGVRVIVEVPEVGREVTGG
jgi:signal transduction histidine kinase